MESSYIHTYIIGTAEAPIKIKLLAPPLYVMTSMTLDKEVGIETMNQAIEAISQCITAKRCFETVEEANYKYLFFVVCMYYLCIYVQYVSR